MFNLISKKKAASALVPLFKAVQQLQYRINQQSNLGFTIYGYANQTEQINAYASIDDLYSIVNRIMKTAAMIPIYEYVVTDEKAYGQLKIKQRQCAKYPTNQNIYEVKKLQTKALELAGEGSPLQFFLDNPNKFQSKNEFYQLTYLFKLLTGNYYIYKETLDAGANAGKVFEMYNMPPNFTFPIASESFPRRCTGYRSTLYNQNQIFEKEEIIHGKYANPIFDYAGNELIGLSPLQAGAKTLTTVSNEIDYANQALKNAGAGGVMVLKQDPNNLTTESLGQIKDDLLRDLGSAWNGNTNINIGKLGMVAGDWEYIKIFIDPANMQLLEQSKRTFKKLCNDYGISDKLFNNDDGAKYDNYDIALKELYTNAALPLVYALCDDFNMGLAPLFGTGVVGYDVSDIPELQENMADVVKRFADSPFIRANDYYEAMGWGKLDDPNADVVLVKTGYQPLDEVATPVDLDTTELDNNNLNDYNR